MTTPEMPSAAKRLENRAREAGWGVVVEQFVHDHTGKHVVTLRLRRDRDRIVAMWIDGKYDGGWQKWWPEPTEGGVSPRRVGSRELTAVVTA